MVDLHVTIPKQSCLDVTIVKRKADLGIFLGKAFTIPISSTTVLYDTTDTKERPMAKYL